jgi:hypothetical protein
MLPKRFSAITWSACKACLRKFMGQRRTLPRASPDDDESEELDRER